MMISSPCRTRSNSRDKWVLAWWTLTMVANGYTPWARVNLVLDLVNPLHRLPQALWGCPRREPPE